MAVLDVQGDLRRRLADALAPVPVRVRVPAERPAELVTVTREGGARENPLIDRPGVGIYCWAASEARAFEIADAAADAMAALPFEGGYANAEQLSMYSDPDPDSRSPRWYMSYALDTFKPKTTQEV